MKSQQQRSRSDLVRIATKAMAERGLEPEFPASVRQQLSCLTGPGRDADPKIRDLRALPWCSIDNDDSLDLDQLTACERLADGAVRIHVAVADVDALVKKGSAIDAHARFNTTSVYTSAKVFPMLPERLSTDLTSLNPGEDRLAVVTEMVVAADGSFTPSGVHRALVHNKAKLAYDAVSAWIDGAGALPDAARAVPGMDAQLRSAGRGRAALAPRRHAQGSLELETFQPRALFDGEQVVDIRQQVQNRARQLIEELMIATNTCTAQFLARGGGASLRRVVRSPERWQRIADVARKFWRVAAEAAGFARARSLSRPPPQGRPVALSGPVAGHRQADGLGRVRGRAARRSADRPLRPGGARLHALHRAEPAVSRPDHAAHAQGGPGRDCAPYSLGELQALAQHCTQQEDAAQKVERRMRKSEAALLLESHVGQSYDAIVTGHSMSDTWVRIFNPPAEGRLAGGVPELEVGQQIRVKLVSTDVERGFIDFVLVD